MFEEFMFVSGIIAWSSLIIYAIYCAYRWRNSPKSKFERIVRNITKRNRYIKRLEEEFSVHCTDDMHHRRKCFDQDKS